MDWNEEKISMTDLFKRIVYFDYNGMTEQGWIKNIVSKEHGKEIVTVCSHIHQGDKEKDLYTEMPIYLSELYLNPLKHLNRN